MIAQDPTKHTVVLVLLGAILAIAVFRPPLLQSEAPLFSSPLPNTPYAEEPTGGSSRHLGGDGDRNQAQAQECESRFTAWEQELAERESQVSAREDSVEEREAALDDERAVLQAQETELEAERADLQEEMAALEAAWRDWEAAMGDLEELRQLVQAERQEARAIRRWSLMAVCLAAAVATLAVAFTLRRIRFAPDVAADRQEARQRHRRSLRRKTGPRPRTVGLKLANPHQWQNTDW